MFRKETSKIIKWHQISEKAARHDISNPVTISWNEKPAEMYFVKRTNILLYGLIHNYNKIGILGRRIDPDSIRRTEVTVSGLAVKTL